MILLLFIHLPFSLFSGYNIFNSNDRGKYAGESRQGRGCMIETPARVDTAEVPSRAV